MPGFLASEASLVRLNRFLARCGFNSQGWGLGRNLGPQGAGWSRHLDRVVQQLTGNVERLCDETSAPVALVGQSLGGVYARELALRLEDRIDRVIMLGSPTFHPYKADRHNRVIGTFGYWLNRQSAAEFAGREGLLHWEAARPGMPCIAIHSPLDGIVDEQACHIPAYIIEQSGQGAVRENIRVLSSHIGMCVNPWVLLAVADRLQADRENWRTFDPYTYFPGFLAPGLSMIYPGPNSLGKQRGAAEFVESHQ
jgi:pimeloyl-ACP methyl ester carboxylesterase